MNERNINMNYDTSGACKKDPIGSNRNARGDYMVMIDSEGGIFGDPLN